jgi:hypothetical protein
MMKAFLEAFGESERQVAHEVLLFLYAKKKEGVKSVTGADIAAAVKWAKKEEGLDEMVFDLTSITLKDFRKVLSGVKKSLN